MWTTINALKVVLAQKALGLSPKCCGFWQWVKVARYFFWHVSIISVTFLSEKHVHFFVAKCCVNVASKKKGMSIFAFFSRFFRAFFGFLFLGFFAFLRRCDWVCSSFLKYFHFFNFTITKSKYANLGVFTGRWESHFGHF